MKTFFVATGIVALAEIGDKTQLLSFVLATRYKRPWPIIGGIFVATLANHGMAGAVGAWLMVVVGPAILQWVLGISFLAMAVWMLIPDTLGGDTDTRWDRYGAFWATFALFFLAEMGDKTQVATIALAARYDGLVSVVAGTTLGMMLANMPVVLFGDAIARRIPQRVVHGVTALIFAVLGIAALIG